jgi:hypothetical protein
MNGSVNREDPSSNFLAVNYEADLFTNLLTDYGNCIS